MRESNHRSHDFARPADSSDHDRRNRSQDELFRLAMERRRHANYIDSMLRRAEAEQASANDRPRATKRDCGE
jgi:hypothetical protein